MRSIWLSEARFAASELLRRRWGGLRVVRAGGSGQAAAWIPGADEEVPILAATDRLEGDAEDLGCLADAWSRDERHVERNLVRVGEIELPDRSLRVGGVRKDRELSAQPPRTRGRNAHVR